MAIFFKLVTPGAATYADAAHPDISLPSNWQPKRIEIVNENQTAANDAFISFDGKEDNGHVVGGTDALAASITYNDQTSVTKIWVRTGAGSAPVLRVLIEQ